MHYLNALPVAPQTCKYLSPLNLFLVYCLSQVVAHSVIQIRNVEVILHFPVSFLIFPLPFSLPNSPASYSINN